MGQFSMTISAVAGSNLSGNQHSLSSWIDAQAQMKPLSALDGPPSSKQVAFAERLARIKRRAVPDECFRDKGLMSKWIDGNR